VPGSHESHDPNRTDEHSSAVIPGEAPAEGARGAAPIPATFGRYAVVREVARGGMGIVLAARDALLGREVAVKVLLDRHAGKPRYHARLVDEARITGALHHPGVIPVHEMGELPDGRPYFVMRYVEGETLEAQLAPRAHPAENLPHFLRTFERVCQTVAYAHSKGVAHLDLKPLNVMVAPFGVVKVTDRGVAKRLGAPTVPLDPECANGEGVIGTPAYMAPEQAQGNAALTDERTDVFGLGGILCAILTGQPPYPGEKTKKVYARASRADLADAFARLNGLHAARELVALAKRCLSPHRDARPRSAAEVVAALSSYFESDLRRAESELVRFFELSPDLFCVAGLDGFFRHVNANFARVLGYTAHELLAKPFVEFVHPDDRAATNAAAEQLARGQPLVQFRNRYRAADGAYHVFEWSAQSLPGEDVIFAGARVVTGRAALHPGTAAVPAARCGRVGNTDARIVAARRWSRGRDGRGPGMLCRFAQLPEQLRQVRGLVVRVQPARVRQHPHARSADRVRLEAERRFRARERDAVRRHAEHREHLRSVLAHLGVERLTALYHLAVGHFGGGRGRARHHVRDAVPEWQQFALLARIEQPRGEAGGEERGPKPVAGPPEVAPDGRGVQARIDAAEQHLQPVRDHIGKCGVLRGEQLRARGFRGHLRPSWCRANSTAQGVHWSSTPAVQLGERCSRSSSGTWAAKGTSARRTK
jgi:serine/threonine-protein kinase